MRGRGPQIPTHETDNDFMGTRDGISIQVVAYDIDLTIFTFLTPEL